MNRLIRLLCAFLLSWGAWAHAQDFLEPEAAFKFSARAIDANTLEARWQIADGYYMYRQKFKFELTGGSLGAIQYPPGKMKVDETFGKVETYRKEVRFALPITRESGATTVTLKVTFQGCADAGLCYMPIVETKRLLLPPLAETPKSAPIIASAKTPMPSVHGTSTPLRRPRRWESI